MAGVSLMIVMSPYSMRAWIKARTAGGYRDGETPNEPPPDSQKGELPEAPFVLESLEVGHDAIDVRRMARDQHPRLGRGLTARVVRRFGC